jgi:holo-[acyl-carrier protein] synthase
MNGSDSFSPFAGRGVLGIGVDLVEVHRFATVLARQGAAFLERVFTEGERGYCGAKMDPAPFYAARFAAKEAVSKAFGTGIGAALGWRDIEVYHIEGGAPAVRLHGKAEALAVERGVKRVWLSLSHTETMSIAQVVLES